MGKIFSLIMMVWLLAGGAFAQDVPLSGLARLGEPGISLKDRRSALTLTVPITQTVPWRVFTLDSPKRLVLDFAEVDWSGADPVALASKSGRVESAAMGLFRPGWSRMVLELTESLVIESAEMKRAGQGAVVTLRLVPTDGATFSARAGAPQNALFDDAAPLPDAAPAPRDEVLTVVLDPGHGGIDPGAEREGAREKDIVLTFARELKDLLLREDWVEVYMTRENDQFVPLETRVALAHSYGADLFISIHADALAEGRAHGATVYTLSDEASDVASQKLAERHERSDLLAGVDLSQTEDSVALVLMDLARTETMPRTHKLADAVVEGLYAATQDTYKSPRLEAGFSVLKAPDIPSVLLELGFLSSQKDREKLLDPAWRQRAAQGVRDGILYWALEDEATMSRRLQ